MRGSATAQPFAILLSLLLQTQVVHGGSGCDMLVDGCCAPKLLIIGAMKCGTNAIMGYLAKHPAFKDTWTKHEVHFLTRAVPDGSPHLSVQGKRHYLSLLTCRRPEDLQLVVDKSPSYLNAPSLAAKAHALMPSAKVIAVMCNPAERMWKQWWHDLRHYHPQQCKEASSSLANARKSFDAHFRHSLRDFSDTPSNPLARGLYGRHLESWISAYGNENVLAVDSSSLEENPLDTMTKVLRFLELNPQIYAADRKVLATKVYASAHPSLHQMAANKLTEFYASDMDHLANLIGESWPRRWLEIETDLLNSTLQEELLKHACEKPRTGLSSFARGAAGPVKREPMRAEGLPMPLDVHAGGALDVTGQTRTEMRNLSFRDGQLVKICQEGGGACKYYTAKVRFSPVRSPDL